MPQSAHNTTDNTCKVQVCAGRPAHRDHRFLGKQDPEKAPIHSSGAGDQPRPEISPPVGASTPSVRHLLHPALHFPGTPRNLRRSDSPKCGVASGRDGTKPTLDICPQSSAAETWFIILLLDILFMIGVGVSHV